MIGRLRDWSARVDWDYWGTFAAGFASATVYWLLTWRDSK